MPKSIKLLLIIVMLFSFATCKKNVRITIDTDFPIQIVNPFNPSLAMGITIFKNGWINLFNDSTFMTLARGLGEAYLRVGGNRADYVKYKPDEIDHNWKRTFQRFRYSFAPNCTSKPRNVTAFNAFKVLAEAAELEFIEMKRLYGIKSVLTPIILTGKEWRQLNKFCQCVGWKLIFGLNFLTRNGSAWDSSNAQLLLNYTENRYHVDWELGNEPNSYEHKMGVQFTPEQVGEGFLKLKSLLNKSPWLKSSLIVGPDVNRISQESSDNFLYSFLKIAANVTNKVTVHHYYLNGRLATENDYLNTSVMDSIIDPILNLKNVMNLSAPHHELWFGETASAYGGGAPGLTNSYIDGFLWLDKLGMTSKLGVQMVFRQTFFGDSYGLVNYDFKPLPSYWLTLLYKRLIGDRVLDVKMRMCYKRRPICNEVQSNLVRIYAHCANVQSSIYNSGSVAVTFTNLKPNAVRLYMEPFNNITLKTDLYLLEPAIQGNLTSQNVNLNGQLLQLTSSHLIPNLMPRRLPPRIIRKGIRIPAHSYGFLVFLNANAIACKQK